jgi:hypothetical protein
MCRNIERGVFRASLNGTHFLYGGIVMPIVILIIVAFIAFACIFTAVSNKNGKQKSTQQIEELKSKHQISAYFVTPYGYLAFCDAEKKIFSFRISDSRFLAIPYLSLLDYQKNQYINGISFWASMPDRTEFISGDVGADQIGPLMSKFDAVFTEAKEHAKEEYSKIISIPTTATSVKVHRYSGINADIPASVSANNTYIWRSGDDIYLMPMFGGINDFRTRAHIYKPIVIKKQGIVALTQEGDVHYTTEVHGGGGGGSSIKGAVIGGVLAGEAGAIIGSRKPTDPITSTTQKIDDRATHMKVLDVNNNFFEIVFNFNDYYVISKLCE